MSGDGALNDDYTGFVRAEYPQVLRTVELMLADREAARDVTQDAFARAYRHWRKACRYDHPAAYVRRIAINLAISQLRRRGVQERALRTFAARPEEAAPSYRDPSILAAVRRLPPSQRAATILFYFEDQPSSEIARILGCSESTARAHLHKARAKLADLLAAHDERRARVAR